MRDIFEIIEEQTLGCDFIEADFSSHHKQMEETFFDKQTFNTNQLCDGSKKLLTEVEL